MSSISETLAEALAYHRAGQLAEALRLYERVLAADAEHVEAHFLRGAAYHGLGQEDEAMTSLARAIRLEPDHAEAHHHLGAVLAQQGKLDEAIASFQRALQLRPDATDISANLRVTTAARDESQGNALAAQGKLTAAVACYRRALEQNPDSAEAHNSLGAVLEQQGSLAAAAACCRRAAELNPGLAEAQYNLGAILRRQGDSAGAVDCYRRALLLKPEFAEAHNNLGSLWEERGRLDDAAACCRRALELRADFAEAHNNLGAVLARQEHYDEAAAECRRALELKPGFAEAHNNLGTALAKQEKRNDAAACYRQAIALKPGFAEAHNNLAAVLRDQDHWEEAAASCRRALELNPDLAEAHGNLGAILTRQEKFDDAAAQYRRALELKPDFAEVHNHLGVLLLTRGEIDRAEVCWRRALELKPDLTEAARNLGALLTRQGRVEEAQSIYLKAIELHPKQDLLRLNLLSLCPTVFNSSEEIERYRRSLLRGLEDFCQTQPRFEPSALATAGCTPSFNLQFHGQNDRPIREAYARLFRDSFPKQEMPPCSSGRPRLGFVVTDRRENGFLKSMGGVLEHMDQDLFELVVIGSERGTAILQSGIRNRAVRRLPIPTTFDSAVNAIRDARFDLLYYWEVGTDGTNYYLPFLRLAPVQCTAWGIQGTSGIPQMSHYLSSALVEPEDARSYYTENLVLASTLLSYQLRVSAPQSPKPREYFGVTAQQHLYLCAQQSGKFQPDFDPILAGILRRDAQGVVVATENQHGGFIADQLRRRFAATMPDVADRIVFLPSLPNPDYLSLVAAADVLLDPLHFGGGNSSYDGFALNRPIVTLPSRFQRGRYTLACYKMMGLSDCVASDPASYIDIALALGADAAYRSEVVEKIRRTSFIIFEDQEAVREHERIFSELVEEARSVRHPDTM